MQYVLQEVASLAGENGEILRYPSNTFHNENSEGKPIYSDNRDFWIRDLAKFLFVSNADLNHKDEAKFTPLLVACCNGHVDIVKFLLDHDAAVNITDSIYWACQYGYVDVVKILVDHSGRN